MWWPLHHKIWVENWKKKWILFEQYTVRTVYCSKIFQRLRKNWWYSVNQSPYPPIWAHGAELNLLIFTGSLDPWILRNLAKKIDLFIFGWIPISMDPFILWCLGKEVGLFLLAESLNPWILGFSEVYSKDGSVHSRCIPGSLDSMIFSQVIWSVYFSWIPGLE